MIRKYVVTKHETGAWYAHKVNFPNCPVVGSFGSKYHAQKVAADCMALPLKEYLKTRV